MSKKINKSAFIVQNIHLLVAYVLFIEPLYSLSFVLIFYTYFHEIQMISLRKYLQAISECGTSHILKYIMTFLFVTFSLVAQVAGMAENTEHLEKKCHYFPSWEVCVFWLSQCVRVKISNTQTQ